MEKLAGYFRFWILFAGLLSGSPNVIVIGKGCHLWCCKNCGYMQQASCRGLGSCCVQRLWIPIKSPAKRGHGQELVRICGQGTIRENLDPMGRHSDRELIGVLKVTRLWDILCGVSLSQAKGVREGAPSGRGRPGTSAARAVPPPRRSLQLPGGGLPRGSPASSGYGGKHDDM